ncbi:MAG: thioesterase family protein [Thermoleophilaceae bacterium]
MADAFYSPAGAGADGAERFDSTEWTRGPWDPDSQHAGPPAALLGRALELHEGGEGMQLGRVTFEILRPIPIAPVEVSSTRVRPGRTVELLEASLSAEGEEIIRARGWRLRTNGVDLPDGLPREDPPPGPDRGRDGPFISTAHEVGYHSATEWRFINGAFVEPGPATVWMRMKKPLVEGEEPSQLTRVLVVADSGNGVSATLDWKRYLFINTDLSVHLLRPPEGEWVCLDAVTIPGEQGVGMSDTALYDERGRIGRSVQTLVVANRGD